MEFAFNSAISLLKARRLILQLILFTLITSTVSAISPQLASAATAGSGTCQQTYTNSAGSESVTVTSSENYCYVAFKNLGAAGSTSSTYSWTKPSGTSSLDVLVIGGGGGGGARQGGGGGAGSFVQATSYPVTSSATNISIVVGSGGAGAAGGAIGYIGSKGSDSSVKIAANGLTALGGGGGINGSSTNVNGGSGGGAGASQTAGAATTSTQKTLDGASTLSGIEFGQNGAKGASENNSPTDYWAAGGGGGAGGVGKRPSLDGIEYTAADVFPDAASSRTRGGDGGVGKVSSIISSTVATSLGIGQIFSSSAYFAAGGGGGIGADGVAGGVGGVGGGGNGTRAVASGGVAAITSTGSGGGGSGFDDINPVAGDVANPPGGAGGSGIVVFRYLAAPSNSAIPTISGTTTFDETLTSTLGDWTNSPISYSYQWSRADSSGGGYSPITNATSSTYRLVSADVGKYLKSTVTATNGAGSNSEKSAATSQIVKATPTFSAWGNVTKTFGDVNYPVDTPTVTESVDGSFAYSSSNSSVISIAGSTFTVVGGGSATITASFTPTNTTNYNSASTTNTVTVDKANQSALSITTTTAAYGTPLTLATNGGSSGGAVTYQYAQGSTTCTLSAGVLTPAASGTCLITATMAGNTNYNSISSLQTTITFTRTSVSATITLAEGVLTYREAKAVSATASVAGKVTFKVNGKVIPGCKKLAVTLANAVATCSYRPSTRGYIVISATLDPTNNSYIGTTTTTSRYFVGNRTGKRAG